MEIVTKIEKALEEIDEFAQGRSNFALAHFVIGQHDMPGRQRRQVLAELQSLLYAIYDFCDKKEMAQIDLDEAEEQIATAEKFEIRRLRVKIRQLKREIWNIDFQLRGREREAITLLHILENMPKYSYEEFEKEEAEYWYRRLTRQSIEYQIGSGGNVSALLEMQTTPGVAKPLIMGQKTLMEQYKKLQLMDEAEGK